MSKNLRLKAARAERDMTQQALAEAAGVSRQTINAIEKGEYNPTIRLCLSHLLPTNLTPQMPLNPPFFSFFASSQNFFILI